MLNTAMRSSSQLSNPGLWRVGAEAFEQFNRLLIGSNDLLPIPWGLFIGVDVAEGANRALGASLSSSVDIIIKMNLLQSDTITSGMNRWVDATQAVLANLVRGFPGIDSKEAEYDLEQDVYVPVPRMPSVEMSLSVHEVPFAKPHVILDFPYSDD